MSSESFSNISVSQTAQSKGFRYLQPYQLKQAVANPTPPIYYDHHYQNWHLTVDEEVQRAEWNHSRDKVIHIIVDIEGNTATVITQTCDHYNYDSQRFEQVHRLGVKP